MPMCAADPVMCCKTSLPLCVCVYLSECVSTLLLTFNVAWMFVHYVCVCVRACVCVSAYVCAYMSVHYDVRLYPDASFLVAYQARGPMHMLLQSSRM